MVILQLLSFNGSKTAQLSNELLPKSKSFSLTRAMSPLRGHLAVLQELAPKH